MFNLSFNTMEWVLNFYVIFVMNSFLFSILFMIFGSKLFKKANRKTSDALIPIYNLFILMQITELPIFYFLLFLFPIINVILIIYIEYKLYKLYETTFLFFIGMLFLPFIFIPILSFGRYQYKSKIYKEVKEEEDKELIENSPILMSEEEIDKLNNSPITAAEVGNLDIDSIFKSNAIPKDDITPYKASKASKDEIKAIYGNNISDKNKIEKEQIKDINESNNEKDKIEIIDL